MAIAGGEPTLLKRKIPRMMPLYFTAVKTIFLTTGEVQMSCLNPFAPPPADASQVSRQTFARSLFSNINSFSKDTSSYGW